MKVYVWLIDSIHRRKKCPTGMISVAPVEMLDFQMDFFSNNLLRPLSAGSSLHGKLHQHRDKFYMTEIFVYVANKVSQNLSAAFVSPIQLEYLTEILSHGAMLNTEASAYLAFLSRTVSSTDRAMEPTFIVSLFTLVVHFRALLGADQHDVFHCLSQRVRSALAELSRRRADDERTLLEQRRAAEAARQAVLARMTEQEMEENSRARFQMELMEQRRQSAPSYHSVSPEPISDSSYIGVVRPQQLDEVEGPEISMYVVNWLVDCFVFSDFSFQKFLFFIPKIFIFHFENFHFLFEKFSFFIPKLFIFHSKNFYFSFWKFLFFIWKFSFFIWKFLFFILKIFIFYLKIFYFSFENFYFSFENFYFSFWKFLFFIWKFFIFHLKIFIFHLKIFIFHFENFYFLFENFLFFIWKFFIFYSKNFIFLFENFHFFKPVQGQCVKSWNAGWFWFFLINLTNGNAFFPKRKIGKFGKFGKFCFLKIFSPKQLSFGLTSFFCRNRIIPSSFFCRNRIIPSSFFCRNRIIPSNFLFGMI